MYCEDLCQIQKQLICCHFCSYYEFCDRNTRCTSNIDICNKFSTKIDNIEDISIINMIEERDKNDNGIYYTSKDVIEMRK